MRSYSTRKTLLAQIGSSFLLLGVAGLGGAQAQNFTTIDVPGATETRGRKINDDGRMVGFYFDTAGSIHSFVRTGQGSFSTFDFPGAAETRAQDINSSGDI